MAGRVGGACQWVGRDGNSSLSSVARKNGDVSLKGAVGGKGWELVVVIGGQKNGDASLRALYHRDVMYN